MFFQFITSTNLWIDEWWEIIKRERCMNLWDKFRWNNQITQTTLSKYGVFQYLMYFISHTNHKYRNSLNDLINLSDFSDNLSNWESTISFKIHRFMMENTVFLFGKQWFLMSKRHQKTFFEKWKTITGWFYRNGDFRAWKTRPPGSNFKRTMYQYLSRKWTICF